MRSRLDSRRLRVVLVGAWLTAALLTVAWFHTRQTSPTGADAMRLRADGRIGEAIAAVRAASREAPSADVFELLGGLERERGQVATAEAAFREARRLDGRRIEATLGLGEVLLARHAPGEAVAVLRTVDPARLSFDQRRRWLGLLAQSGDGSALQAAVTAVLDHAPADPTALRHALALAEQRHEWAQAVGVAERLIAADPASAVDTRRRLARALEADGAAAEALAVYDALDDDSTWAQRVALLSTLGRPREAADLWVRHEPTPASASERARRAELFQRAGRNVDAERDYRAALAAGGLGEESRVGYAWLLNRARRHDEAWRLVASLVESRTHLDVLAFTAGWAGEDAAAARLLPRWLARHPHDLAGWALLAEVARRRGDLDQRTRALATLARLDASPTRQTALARHLASAGSAAPAIAAYRAVLASGHTLDAAALEEFAVLLEQEGRFSEALQYLEQRQRLHGARADLLLREARLRRWSADANGAVAALSRAQQLDGGLASDPGVQADYASALADLAHWEEAAAALTIALRSASAEGGAGGDLHRVAALVATRLGRPAEAVRHLQAVAMRRALTPDERRWLAGQAEEAGLWPVAVAEYDRLIVTGTANADELWRKIADLEDRQGHDSAALAAWQQVSPAARDDTYWRRLTWAAAKVSRRAASDAYDEAFAAGARGGEQWLEAARLHADGGDPVEAIGWYERYLTTAPAAAPQISAEVGRACLAAGRPADALSWIAKAPRMAGADRELVALEAQALHMLGRSREAATRLASLVRNPGAASPATVGEWYAWLGRTAQARGRLLDASSLFAEAIARGATPSADLWLARGDLAAQRRDVSRARRAYLEAQQAGDQRASSRLAALTEARQPTLTLPFETFGDSNDFGHVSASARVALRPSDRARVTGEYASGRISQRDVAFTRQAVTVAVDRLYPTERTSLAGQVAIEQARGRTQPLYRAEGGYAFRSGASLTAQAFRESPWRADAWDARLRYNRITDLAVIAGDFHATGSSAGATVPVGRHEVLGNASVRRFSDGNRQVQAYVQYQVPISSRADTWVAVQPYVYGERWQRQAPAYFSPEAQVTAGATLRAIVTRGAWVFDAAATPQYLDSAARSGFGYAAVGSVRRDVGRLSLGASGMIFDDVQLNYRVQRLTIDVSVPVGR